MWVVVLAIGLAVAAEPPASPWSEPGEELVVHADGDLSAARAALERAIADAGFQRRRDRDGRTVFPRSAPWKPKLILYDDGRMELRTHTLVPLAVVPRLRGGGYRLDFAGVFSTRRQVGSAEGEIVDSLSEELVAWRDALWRRGLAERRSRLREEMLHAWFDGVDPDGLPLPSRGRRRRWLVEQWLDTANNDAGAAVRTDIEVFIDEIVQRSDSPFTRQEFEAAGIDHCL